MRVSALRAEALEWGRTSHGDRACSATHDLAKKTPKTGRTMCVRTANRTPSASTCAPRPLRSRRSTFLALKWGATRSDVVRSMIVGRALAQLDRLEDALDASEPSFDALVDVPSIDDVLAAP